jgi:hypothetical protein
VERVPPDSLWQPYAWPAVAIEEMVISSIMYIHREWLTLLRAALSLMLMPADEL